MEHMAPPEACQNSNSHGPVEKSLVSLFRVHFMYHGQKISAHLLLAKLSLPSAILAIIRGLDERSWTNVTD